MFVSFVCLKTSVRLSRMSYYFSSVLFVFMKRLG